MDRKERRFKEGMHKKNNKGSTYGQRERVTMCEKHPGQTQERDSKEGEKQPETNESELKSHIKVLIVGVEWLAILCSRLDPEWIVAEAEAQEWLFGNKDGRLSPQSDTLLIRAIAL
jgi:hypothetical protein